MNVIELMILLNKFVFVYFQNIGTIVEKFLETLVLRIAWPSFKTTHVINLKMT